MDNQEVENANSDPYPGYKVRLLRAAGALAAIILGAAVVYLVIFPSSPLGRKLFHLECVPNLKGLRKVLIIHSYDYMSYPAAQKWCDLLADNYGTKGGKLFDEKLFVCKSALAEGDNGRCHYAINPNCKPNSPADTVLLFETKGGWNQYGGPEILTFQNHKGKGCYILLNDGRVQYVRPDEIDKLKW